ncbi:hypothetical protein FSP39_007966 [Pinctada imbricata]|uniref:Reverse transcriptase domain-containing protein n=1 Tax=Pinctada imbricata TaxID=66713 RepID=A0AA88XZC1_PINIB|nr:hypothetical protein FSP39_007966 [Pinctada imbricata]
MCLDLWDHFKECVKDFTSQYCKEKAQTRRQVIRTLEREYHKLQFFEKSNPGQYIDRIRAIKDKIKEIETDNYKGAKIRSKADNLNSDENLSNFFFRKETKRARQKLITKIRTESSELGTTGEILGAFRDFYQNLYTSEEIDDDLVDFFLSDVPTLDDEDRELCEGQITKEEVWNALKAMENNKSPGCDGLTKEFYYTFFDIIGERLVEVANMVFETGSLSETQKLGYITLLLKDKSHSDNVKYYRPISLLNVDYKIISKVITNRVGLVMDKLVHKDQTCAVRGRSIFDNLHMLRDIQNYCEQKDSPVAFICLDQEKAFDRVNYSFMFRTLSAFNFGPSLIKWVNILYHDIKSSVIVNSTISEPFRLTRGVRQGCSLSPLLYVLLLEPFAKKVREDSDIVGVKLPGSPESVKLSMYADDSTGICSTEKSIEKLLFWSNHYGKASGSKLALFKTKGLWLGKWKTRSDHPFGISWVDSTKILGIPFGAKLTLDDIWQPVLQKFQKTLNLWQQRRLSLKEKSLVVNSLACSKIWYTGTLVQLPDYYVKQFERAIFHFVWQSKSEPLRRTVAYRSFLSGGLNLIHVKTKVQALHIKHLLTFVLNPQHTDKQHFTFVNYWLGLSLRHLAPQLQDNSIPHSDTNPAFYSTCLRELRRFLDFDPLVSTNMQDFNVKTIYTFLISHYVTEPNIFTAFPSIEFDSVFKLLNAKTIEKFSFDTSFRLIHEILPVNYRMYRFNIYSSNICTFCKADVETITHLFAECPCIKSLLSILQSWLNVMSEGNFSHVSIDNLRLFDLPSIPSADTRRTILYLITQYIHTVWSYRCTVKFNKKTFSSRTLMYKYISQVRLRIQADHYRYPFSKFEQSWIFSTNNIFVTDDTDEQTLHLNLPL